jgi:hypothetical protein
VATRSPSIIKTGDATSSVVNSPFAPLRTTDGSLALVSTLPTELRIHWTLARIQLVSALKRSLNVDFPSDVTHDTGEKTHKRWLISGR